MHLGFVSAILGELSLEEVLAFAADEGFACVEVMCWPPGKTERRYAGVCHLDVTNFTGETAGHVQALTRKHGVAISGLGYYPNPLDPDAAARDFITSHLRKVIAAAKQLGVGVVNTFIGRDPRRPIEEQWEQVRAVWGDILQFAEEYRVRIGIENCPMLFSRDEWPGGKNLAVSPAVWRRMFNELPSQLLGLNFDPSHLVWQHIDYLRCVREFGARFVHVHAKDMRIDREKLDEVGILGMGWSTPKIPGMGEVNWGLFVGALTDAGYNGPVCIEVEDRAFEHSVEDRKRSLRLSKRYLEQFVG